jgi:hypothetical protein
MIRHAKSISSFLNIFISDDDCANFPDDLPRYTKEQLHKTKNILHVRKLYALMNVTLPGILYCLKLCLQDFLLPSRAFISPGCDEETRELDQIVCCALTVPNAYLINICSLDIIFFYFELSYLFIM